MDAFVIYLMIGYAVIKIFEKLRGWLTGKPLSMQDGGSWNKVAPYTHIVGETIQFCGGLLYENGIKHFPRFTIRYYRHKKFGDIFNGEIVIYLKSNPDLESLVNITLHEVRHYIQSLTDKQYKRYDDFTRDLGYWDNPLEVDAREFAARHQQAALQHLEMKNLIKASMVG